MIKEKTTNSPYQVEWSAISARTCFTKHKLLPLGKTAEKT